MKDLDLLENVAPEIEITRSYWLVRTMGGDYYSEYSSRGYIAIGYNEIPQNEIEEVIKAGDKAQKLLVEKIIIIDEEEEINKSYAASQLIKFHRDMKIGDVVIMPGKRSEKIRIGFIDSDVYTELNVSKDQYACHFDKRRRVEWVDEVVKGKLNPYLQLMFNSRHIISNVDHYSEYLDCIINDFYIKDNQSFLVLKVKQENEIAANDLSVIFQLIDIFDEFVDEQNLDIDSNDINIKISVQSPGDIILSIVDNPMSLFIFGAIMVFINGGSFKIEKLGLDISTNGLIKNISEFLDRRTERIEKKKVAEKLNKLEVTNPKDIVNLMKITKKDREKY